jgi:Skp family chaperone for outer membrane proteins
MRKFIVVYTFMVLSPAWAQQFGFVEDQLILEKLPAVKEVQRILDQENAIWEKEFKDRQGVIKVYLDSIQAVVSLLTEAREALTKAEEETTEEEKPSPVEQDSSSVPDSAASQTGINKPMTPGKPAETSEVDTVLLRQNQERLEETLERAKKEIVALYREIYGKDGVLERRNAELSQSVFEKIHQAVTETSEREGADMVFDSSIILYVDQDLNLTEQVMETLGIGEQQLR